MPGRELKTHVCGILQRNFSCVTGEHPADGWQSRAQEGNRLLGKDKKSRVTGRTSATGSILTGWGMCVGAVAGKEQDQPETD